MKRPRPVPGLRRRRVGAAELLEDQPLLLGRDARAAVGDVDEHAAVRA